MCAQCSPAIITFSSLRGSPRIARYVPSPLPTRGTSSCTPPVPISSCGPAEPSGLVTYRPRLSAGPPPNTESRSSAGVRVLGEVSGLAVTPRCEVWSKVMSWSVNWPTNVEPAVIVGLSGLVPYGLAAVGLPVHRRVDDQFFRAGRQVVAGVHDAALCADLQQRGLDRARHRRERRKLREDPAEQHAAGRGARQQRLAR